MTINKKAIAAFRQEARDNVIIDEILSNAMTAALQEMYTDVRAIGLHADSQTGELFVVMNNGACWKYTQDEPLGKLGTDYTLYEKETAPWRWRRMSPIPGTVAAGGRELMDNVTVSMPAPLFHGFIEKLKEIEKQFTSGDQSEVEITIRQLIADMSQGE